MAGPEYTDPGIRKAIKKTRAAIIPVGSTEQHGAHLPVSTDTDIVSEVSSRLAKKLGCVLLPAMQTGVSYEHAPLFHASIKPATLRAVLRDLCDSLKKSGIKTIFIINGHHGNTRALGPLNAPKKGIHVFSYWRFMAQEFDHAGLAETSLMLAVSKSVKMSKARKGLDTSRLDDIERARISRLAQKSFIRATGNGIWGDPRGATVHRGRQMLHEIVQNLSKTCQTCLTGGGP